MEQELLRTLGAWSLASITAGSAAWAHGRYRSQPVVQAWGRQNAAWGAVNGAIAGAGWLRNSRDRDPEATPEHAERLRRTLRLNAGLDLGYIAAGVGLVLLRKQAGRLPRYTPGQAVGDGLGIVLQGGFLYWLDTKYAARLEES